jgi:KipI family sensor histidine kinase inhibitor
MRVRDVVDGASLVDFPAALEEEGNRRAVAMAEALAVRPPDGFLAAVPGASTLLLLFDPLKLPAERLRQKLGKIGRASVDSSPRRRLRIPVLYGGLDLAELAQERSLSPEEFTRLHAAGSYRVAFLGFAPGFAYLTGLARELHAPRLATPRTRVPAGSVAIGGSYTGIYPDETPGGWRLIGRSPVRLFDAEKDPPSLMRPGDLISFEPIGSSDFNEPLFRRPPKESASDEVGRPLLRVLSPGLFSSVQGGPVYRWTSVGVPPGGAMDLAALADGNARLGNRRDVPALEMTAMGPELEALENLDACFSGADAAVESNGRQIPLAEAFSLRAGERLRVGRVRCGMRSYLCVRGGLATADRLAISRRAKAGDLLAAPLEPLSWRSAAVAYRNPFSSGAAQALVRVVLAEEPSFFTEESVRGFLATPYRVSSASDRRGVRLEGAPLTHRTGPDIAPEGTAPGAIQVPRDGMPILLGPDRPVTGGYAKVGTVIGADLSVLAQAAPGAVLRFAAVTLPEALEARVNPDAG